ncbi:g4600 [Coccomyxa viridis]|uniref:S-acyltransferase n=1 Tax=Coccomyxa viridis TaxID=1274662 RepID=A0ABP1FVY2_9CHLO
MRGCLDHGNYGRKGQAQATIVARVAYVLLHTFILSTVFRCKSDVNGSWISHMAYVAGFCAVLLVSNALYIALAFMDPGYIPAVKGLKLQSGDGEGIHMTGISTARSTSPGSAAAPGFDFEGLLHGAARLPSTNSLAPDASSKGIEPAQTVIEHGRAAALHRASAHAEWTEPDHDSSVSTLRSLEEGLCWRDQDSVKAGSAHVSSLACDQEHQTTQCLSSQGHRNIYSKAAHHTAAKAEVLPGEGSPGSSAGQLIGALHGSGWHGEQEHESASGPGSRERAWWEKPGAPGRRCERCGAFQRLRAHHCAACERCVDTHDHDCAWLGTCIGARNQCMYLGFLVAQTASCAWAAHAALPCLANPHPLLPWHTLFGVDWRVAATMLLLLGLLLPFLAYLLAQQLYLAATAQTARECFRRDQVPYLMHVNRRVHPFSRGILRNVWNYVAWRPERHWELPSTEELLQRQMQAGRGGSLC